MPDIQNMSLNVLAAQNVSMPRLSIEAQITDSQTGAVLFDFTGANNIVFPQYVAQMTVADRRAFVEYIAIYLIRHKSGGAI